MLRIIPFAALLYGGVSECLLHLRIPYFEILKQDARDRGPASNAAKYLLDRLPSVVARGEDWFTRKSCFPLPNNLELPESDRASKEIGHHIDFVGNECRRALEVLNKFKTLDTSRLQSVASRSNSDENILLEFAGPIRTHCDVETQLICDGYIDLRNILANLRDKYKFPVISRIIQGS